MTADLCMKRDIESLCRIIKCCDNVGDDLLFFGSDEEDFFDSPPFQRSCAFSVQEIGESVKRLSSELTQKHPEVEWKKIAGLMDIIVHNYGRIEMSDLWNTITRRVPELREQCVVILSELEL